MVSSFLRSATSSLRTHAIMLARGSDKATVGWGPNSLAVDGRQVHMTCWDVGNVSRSVRSLGAVAS